MSPLSFFCKICPALMMFDLKSTAAMQKKLFTHLKVTPA